MRDPITKLSIVTKETCDPGIYKVLSQSQSISDAHQDPIDNHIKINIVYFAGKVVRKTKGMMNSSETSVLVLGDQAVYLYQSSNGQLKRTIPIKEINKILVYPQSQLLFSTSQKEYDLLVQFESPAKDKQAPEIDFVINVLQVCCDVLFNNKKPVIEKRQTNPLDDKEGNNLKKPEVHREVTIPLTSFRVPLVKSTVPIENLIRPNAPSAQSNQNAPDLQRLRDDDAAQEQLSPQARSVLKHPLFAGMKTTTPEDEDDTETETEDEQQSPRNVNRRLSADQQQQNEVGDDENQSEAAPRAFPMPMPPGGASIASSSRTITSPTGGYSPNVQPRGILKKDTPVTEQEEEISKRNEELTRRLKQVETLQRSVEQQQIQAIEMCDYIQKMTQSVREVSRTPPRSTSEEPATSNNKNSTNHDSGLNDDSSSVPNPAGGNKSDSNNATSSTSKNNKADEKTAATKESSQQQKATKDASSSVLLPSALQKVTPAPPALLPDSFVKAVFGDDHPSHQLRSNNNMMMIMSSATTPGAASRTVTSGNGVVAASSSNTVNADGSSNSGSLRSSSPNTSATLSSYYQQARSPAKSGTTGGEQQKLSVVMAPPQNEEEIEKRKNMLLQEAMAEARKQVLKEQQEAASAKALSPQDLQDEVVRRVRAAEDMFAQRPANEKAIFRRFHIEQRQRYLTELQAAVTTGKRPAPLAYSHFKFEGQSSTPFPLAIDIFLTQQELLYLLRIAQAEQPSANVLGSGNNNSNNNPANGNYDGSSWNGASENVFAAQQNIYSAPVHQDLGGPLEPLAAHTSPEPPTTTTANKHQQQQQRWEDLTPQQQEEARRYWANQQQQAPAQPQQPQQPAASSSTYHHHRQQQQAQQPQQPVQPQQPMQPASSPQPRQPVRNVNNNASGNIRPSPGLATYKQRYR